jgi:hypothetical protein
MAFLTHGMVEVLFSTIISVAFLSEAMYDYLLIMEII